MATPALIVESTLRFLREHVPFSEMARKDLEFIAARAQLDSTRAQVEAARKNVEVQRNLVESAKAQERSSTITFEDTALVASYAGPFVRGMQGDLGEDSVIACAKHWIGDGGTRGGRVGPRHQPHPDRHGHRRAPHREHPRRAQLGERAAGRDP